MPCWPYHQRLLTHTSLATGYLCPCELTRPIQIQRDHRRLRQLGVLRRVGGCVLFYITFFLSVYQPPIFLFSDQKLPLPPLGRTRVCSTEPTVRTEKSILIQGSVGQNKNSLCHPSRNSNENSYTVWWTIGFPVTSHTTPQIWPKPFIFLEFLTCKNNSWKMLNHTCTAAWWVWSVWGVHLLIYIYSQIVWWWFCVVPADLLTQAQTLGRVFCNWVWCPSPENAQPNH